MKNQNVKDSTNQPSDLSVSVCIQSNDQKIMLLFPVFFTSQNKNKTGKNKTSKNQNKQSKRKPPTLHTHPCSNIIGRNRREEKGGGG